MRYVKKYVAGAIPTPKEVADLTGKVNTLEQQNAAKDAKILKLEAYDKAFTQSLADDVVADALVERTIKASISRVDGVIGDTIKSVETLKDRAQNAEASINSAKDSIENLERSVNSAGSRANQAWDKAAQNENSITGLNQTLQNVAVEQQQQNVRIDDLEADAQESGGNFDQLKSTGVLMEEEVIPPKTPVGRTVVYELSNYGSVAIPANENRVFVERGGVYQELVAVPGSIPTYAWPDNLLHASYRAGVVTIKCWSPNGEKFKGNVVFV